MDSTPKNGSDILDSITSSDALKILRIFMERNKELKGEIRKIALEVLSGVNPEKIAVDVMQALDRINGGVRFFLQLGPKNRAIPTDESV